MSEYKDMETLLINFGEDLKKSNDIEDDNERILGMINAFMNIVIAEGAHIINLEEDIAQLKEQLAKR